MVIKQNDIKELANSIGNFIEYWGFKRLHGEIWTLIYLAEKPLSTEAIIKNLSISKASVSLAIKDLIHYQLIIPQNKIAKGIHTYKINPQVVKVIFSILRKRELKLLKKSETSCRKILKKISSTKELRKVKELHDMIKTSRFFLEALTSIPLNTVTDWKRIIPLTKLFFRGSNDFLN